MGMRADLKEMKWVITISHIPYVILLNWSMVYLLYSPVIKHYATYYFVWADLEKAKRRKKFSYLLIKLMLACSGFSLKREIRQGGRKSQL